MAAHGRERPAANRKSVPSGNGALFAYT